MKPKLLIIAFLFLAIRITSNTVAAKELDIEVFVSEPHEINTTSALIKGTTEMMVVCAQPNISAATRLAQQIEKTGLELKYIFLTHAHLDHFQGASILLKKFPAARFIATPEIAALQRMRIKVSDEIAVARYGDNAAVPSIEVGVFEGDILYIDGEPVELWRGFVGDAALGHAEEEHTVVYVPSTHTLIPSDIVYYNAHVMMGGSTQESRKTWMNQLENWLAKDFSMVIPGHMPKGSDLTPKGALTHTLNYVKAYDEVIAIHNTPEDVIAAMKQRFPDIKHESALLIGTYINFRKMHKLSFSPTVEAIFSILPSGVATWIDNKIYEQRQEQWNGTEQNETITENQ